MPASTAPVSIQHEMSTHYGRMVAADDALMLFSRPDRGDGAPDVMSWLATSLTVAGRRLLSRAGERLAALDERPLPQRILVRAMPLPVSRRFHPGAARELDAVFELRVRDPHGAPPACSSCGSAADAVWFARAAPAILE